jgi:hypothetical protein
MDTAKDPQVRVTTSNDAVNGTSILHQTSVSEAIWHDNQGHHSNAKPVDSERVA